MREETNKINDDIASFDGKREENFIEMEVIWKTALESIKKLYKVKYDHENIQNQIS